MEFEQFERIINHIKDHHDKSVQFYKLCGGSLNIANWVESDLVDVLQLYFNDTIEVISWWIYETDFGIKDIKITTTEPAGVVDALSGGEEINKTYYLRTVRDLWDFLTEEE